VAQRLLACVRTSDTVSRQGGDEFVILLSELSHSQDAAVSAEKILSVLGTPHRIDQHDLHVTASIGISTYPDDGTDAEPLIRQADFAMYHAKDSGRNNYQFFEPEMNLQALERRSVEDHLRRALARGEFELYSPRRSSASRRSCAGVIRYVGSCTRSTLYQSQRNQASLYPSAGGSSRKPAGRHAHGETLGCLPSASLSTSARPNCAPRTS
jgi:hypothetical protein